MFQYFVRQHIQFIIFTECMLYVWGCNLVFLFYICDPEHQNKIFLMAKQMVKERQDITGLNGLKGSIRQSDCR